jgi:hypothetical protein
VYGEVWVSWVWGAPGAVGLWEERQAWSVQSPRPPQELLCTVMAEAGWPDGPFCVVTWFGCLRTRCSELGLVCHLR